MTNNFNDLVYEYLYKQGYTETAVHFAKCANVDKTAITNTDEPTLKKWYEYFVETSEVRNGSPYHVSSSHRIESIMLALEIQKKRHSEIVEMCTNDMTAQKYKEKNIKSREEKQQVNSPNSLTNNSSVNSVQTQHTTTNQFSSIVKSKSISLNLNISECVLVDSIIFATNGFTILGYDLKQKKSILSISDSTIKHIKVIKNTSDKIHLVYTTNQSVIKVLEIAFDAENSTISSKNILTMQHNNQIKSMELFKSFLFILDIQGYVSVFNLSGMRITANLFDSKIIYDMASSKNFLFMVDSNNAVLEFYSENFNEFKILETFKYESVLSVKNDILYVGSLNINVYLFNHDLKRYTLSKTLNPQNKAIDVVLADDIFITLKRNELIIYDTEVGVNKGHSVYAKNIGEIIVITDEGVVEVYELR